MILAQKLSLIGGSLIAFSVVFGFVAFDQILKFGIRDQTALRKRNEIRGIYLKLPFPLDFRVYFFNVTNPMEVQTGAIPILAEMGPYCYDEYLDKVDPMDNDGEDSLTYSLLTMFKFNQERSGKLSDDDYVTILHPLVTGMVNQVSKSSPALLPIVNKAIGLLFPDLQSIYLTAKVREILFDGLAINCKSTEFQAKAVCTQVKTKIPGIKMLENEIYLFSLLGPRNATKGKRVKVLRGISKSKDLGRIVEVDGKRQLDLWGTEECNTFKGTDGWIFPPLMTHDEELSSYSADLCRTMTSSLSGETELKGINVFRYDLELGDMDHNEEEKCYCETPRTCLKKGVFDLTKCMGVPIYATLPHFLKTDETYLKQVKGVNPVFENHTIKVFLEPMTAAPIEAHIRMQFNFPIAPNSKITLMKNIPQALHPLFWIEQNLDLEGDFLKKVQNIFLIINIMKIGRWVGIALGTVIIGYGMFDYFKEKKDVRITPIHNPETVSNSVSQINSSVPSINESDINKRKARSILNGHEFDRY